MILRVLPQPVASTEGNDPPMVPDYKQLFRGKKCFVGWKHDSSLGDEVEYVEEDGRKVKVRSGGFRMQMGVVVALDVADMSIARRYARHIADGDLLAADKETVEAVRKLTGVTVKLAPAAELAPAPKKTPSSPKGDA